MKSFSRNLFLLLVLLGLSSCASSPELTVRQSVSDDEVNQIASKLYCPICENIPLDVCPSKACSDWRELIRSLIIEGKSEKEITQFFSEQYGWKVLSMPPRVGFNWFLYTLPPAITILGGLMVALTVQKKRNQQAPKSKPETIKSEPEMAEYMEIIQKDLEENDHAE